MLKIARSLPASHSTPNRLAQVLSSNTLSRFNFLLAVSKMQVSEHHVSSKFKLFPDKAYINGKWVDSASSNRFDVFNPATNEKLGSVPECNVEDVNQAVESADKAFKIWSSYTAEQRSKVLKKMVELHIEHRQHLGEIITYENGKPINEALVEIDTSTKAYDWFSEEAKRVYGDIIPSPVSTKKFLVMKQPVGVCGILTPWNFPSSMIARKVSAALAAGCTVVIKPSEDTPYSALALAQVAEMAGLPAGCLNIVTTSKKSTPIVGQAICEHPTIRKVSFTGSTPVGKIILGNCAKGVKRVQMELGGNAPFIIFDSADLKKAIAGVMAAKFRCSGQTCICANRIIVQEGIYDKFLEELAKAMKEQLVVGSGFDKGVTQGPLISKAAVSKVNSLVEDSRAKGAKVILGGKPSSILSGNFYEPTLISDIKLDMAIAKEEIFGPVAAVIKFKTEEDALRIANSVEVGLGGYFYSQDISQIWRVAEKLEVGMVGVNESIISTIEAPFSGVKQSGFGYEGSKYGINEYLHNKYVCLGV